VKAEVFKTYLVPLLADVFAGTLLAGEEELEVLLCVAANVVEF
jgi:hypothetical protein